MVRISRRTALWLFGGGLASLGISYAGVRSFTDEDLVRGVLERYLGPLNMADDQLRAFVLEFRERNPWIFPTEKLADASTLLEKARLAATTRSLLPEDDAKQLERFERRLLGDFHLITDFAWRRTSADPVSYTGWQGCVNPFANFETT